MQLKAPKSYYNYLLSIFLCCAQNMIGYTQSVVLRSGVRVTAHVRTHTMTALLAGSQASSSGD